MNVIKPNCRVQFAAQDVDFILSVLGGRLDTSATLVKLLADETTRDLILDDEALYRALLERNGCLQVTSHFYFYILVRQVFLRAGIKDRNVADYVAEVLAEFARSERTRCLLPGQTQGLDYFFEMMAALQTADEHNGFQLRAHIGNYSLFLSGVFPERIRVRSERRGFPDLRYYIALGKSHFRMASNHRLAHRYQLAGIFDTLSDQFETTRRALNAISERLFCLEPGIKLPGEN